MLATTQPQPSQSSLISLEDFLGLPETETASEYIKGNITQKPRQQGKRENTALCREN